MNGFVIVNTRTGSHVTSQCFVPNFGLTDHVLPSAADAPEQALSVLIFTLVAAGQTAFAEGSDDASRALPIDATSLSTRLESAGVSAGYDMSSNASPVDAIDLGNETAALFIFMHPIFPLAGGAVWGVPASSALGRSTIRDITIQFCHQHGLAHVEASSNGVVRPFRKQFAPVVARCLMHALASCTKRLVFGDAAPPGGLLPSVGQYIAFALALSTSQRDLLLLCRVVSGGEDWSVTLYTNEAAAEAGAVRERFAAFDQYLVDVGFSHHVSSIYSNARVEVHGGADESFSIMQVPLATGGHAESQLPLVVSSSHRLCALEAVLLNPLTGTASDGARIVASLVHAVNKLGGGNLPISTTVPTLPI